MNCRRRRLERVGVRTRITFAFGFGLGHALHEVRSVVFTVRMRIQYHPKQYHPGRYRVTIGGSI